MDVLVQIISNTRRGGNLAAAQQLDFGDLHVLHGPKRPGTAAHLEAHRGGKAVRRSPWICSVFETAIDSEGDFIIEYSLCLKAGFLRQGNIADRVKI